MAKGRPIGVAVRRDGVGIPTAGVDGSVNAAGVSVVPGVSNVAGAWTEVVAATTTTSSFLSMRLFNTSATGTAIPMLLDVGIGAAASEVAIISSIACGQASTSTTGGGFGWKFPITIQAGSRISVRLTTANATVGNGLIFCATTARDVRTIGKVSSRVVPIGANAAASTGVAITSNDTWVQITAATTEPFCALVSSFGGNDAVMTGGTDLWSIGIGASGAETLLGSYPAVGTTTETWSLVKPFDPVSLSVPAGSRLVAKSSLGATNAVTCVLFGIPYA